MWQNWLKGFGLPECRNETPFLSQVFVADIVDISDCMARVPFRCWPATDVAAKSSEVRVQV
jgi:hypothetical protein